MTGPDSDTETADSGPDRTLEGFVGRQAARLWRGYAADRADAVSEMARLRRALPRRRVIPPEAWETFERAFPPQLAGRGDAPSWDELAAATSLALFALHQQSRRTRPMHVLGREHTVGSAADRLRRGVDSQGVERRVQALARANDLDPLLEHLRALVTQLKAAEIPLDYGRLANDLRSVQHPTGLRGVRTRWLRDFYRPRAETSDVTLPTSQESV